MNEYTWRQSGLDALSHAFASEGGFIHTVESESQTPAEVAEYHVSACREMLPLAFVMYQGGGAPCEVCQNATTYEKSPELRTGSVIDLNRQPIR
ncbi:hypothetical protein [Saccharopolyspora phatthalungensis]|uniref:Uncharacterized protein n=1 Tax=Saccharopolyspora phatthalungensis TaxID=664693 RepID=A0A840QH62_9PSEU|nr:hypothetical protein [Saccharopolyspora phatthalungensis]MBB5159310.1 hypothetical protein [Saccharopolyspora phatthalungensis]